MITTCESNLAFAHARQRGKSVHARKPDIEQDDVVGLSGKTLKTGFAAVDGIDAVAFVTKHASERAPHTRLVIDDQNRWHLCK